MTAPGGGDHLQLIFLETNTIVFGRNYNWVELSQVTARGVTFNLSLVETDTIVFGRNYLGSGFLKYK